MAAQEVRGQWHRLATQRERSHPLLVQMGGRAGSFRIERGMHRRVAAELAGISERHLGSLERGNGNVSILVLQQLAIALQCSLNELVEDEMAASTEWLQIRELLRTCTEYDLYRARLVLAELFGPAASDACGASFLAT